MHLNIYHAQSHPGTAGLRRKSKKQDSVGIFHASRAGAYVLVGGVPTRRAACCFSKLTIMITIQLQEQVPDLHQTWAFIMVPWCYFPSVQAHTYTPSVPVPVCKMPERGTEGAHTSQGWQSTCHSGFFIDTVTLSSPTSSVYTCSPEKGISIVKTTQLEARSRVTLGSLIFVMCCNENTNTRENVQHPFQSLCELGMVMNPATAHCVWPGPHLSKVPTPLMSTTAWRHSL